MAESLLTVPEAAIRLQLSPLTVQRQLRRGVLRGIKRGKFWRVPESALLENPPAPTVATPTVPQFPQVATFPTDTPKKRAAAILAEMESGDLRRRNAALVALYYSDEPTREIISEAATRAVAEWEEA